LAFISHLQDTLQLKKRKIIADLELKLKSEENQLKTIIKKLLRIRVTRRKQNKLWFTKLWVEWAKENNWIRK
jgi:hypothetical protein